MSSVVAVAAPAACTPAGRRFGASARCHLARCCESACLRVSCRRVAADASPPGCSSSRTRRPR
eukprot:2555887-Pleurochrysis_carterae.AAC.2